MDFRRVREGQRGATTVEWLAVGSATVALAVAVGVAVPAVGEPVRDGVETLICRAISPVTGGTCAAPEHSLADGPPDDLEPPPEDPPEEEPPEDEPPEKPEPPGEDEPPGDEPPGDEPPPEDGPGDGDEPGPKVPDDDQDGEGEDDGGEDEPGPEDLPQPGLDQCVPVIEEGIDQAVIEALGWPYPGLGGRLGGIYWTFKEQRADGKWQVTPIWYGDGSVLVGTIGNNAFAGRYGMDGQTWVVDTEEEADQIIAEHRLRPYRHLPGSGVIAPLRAGVDVVDTVVDWGLGLFGLGSEDHGPPQSEFVDVGSTGGFQIYPNDDFRFLDFVPFDNADETGGVDGQTWYGTRVAMNPAAGEVTYYVTVTMDVAGNLDVRYPPKSPGQLIGSGRAAGEGVVRLGLVQDLETGAFTHVDYFSWAHGTVGLGAGMAVGGPQGNLRVGGGPDLWGRRRVWHGRLPLGNLLPEDRENAIAWMQALTGATTPGEAQAALAQQELGELFESGATLTEQTYETHGRSGTLDTRIGTPSVGVGIDPAMMRRTYELIDARYWAPGHGMVEWTDCHA